MNHPLSFSPVLKLRRNHALEHATLQVLSRRKLSGSLAGISDAAGFWIFGSVNTVELTEAAAEALAELKGGNRSLAVHPHCGSNFLTSGLVAGSAAWLAMLGTGGLSFKKKLDRWPVVIALVSLTLILAQPLGPLFQARVMTEADMGDLRILQVLLLPRHNFPIHRVSTR